MPKTLIIDGITYRLVPTLLKVSDIEKLLATCSPSFHVFLHQVIHSTLPETTRKAIAELYARPVHQKEKVDA